MKDIKDKELKYGDIILISYNNWISFGVYKEYNNTHRFYSLRRDYGIKKLKSDLNIEKLFYTRKDKTGNTIKIYYKGTDEYINTLNNRVLVINEDLLPKEEYNNYQEMKKYFNKGLTLNN